MNNKDHHFIFIKTYLKHFSKGSLTGKDKFIIVGNEEKIRRCYSQWRLSRIEDEVFLTIANNKNSITINARKDIEIISFMQKYKISLNKTIFMGSKLTFRTVKTTKETIVFDFKNET